MITWSSHWHFLFLFDYYGLALAKPFGLPSKEEYSTSEKKTMVEQI